MLQIGEWLYGEDYRKYDSMQKVRWCNRKHAPSRFQVLQMRCCGCRWREGLFATLRKPWRLGRTKRMLWLIIIQMAFQREFTLCLTSIIQNTRELVKSVHRYLVVMLGDFLAFERFELTFFLTNDIIISRYNDIICAVKGGAVYWAIEPNKCSSECQMNCTQN